MQRRFIALLAIVLALTLFWPASLAAATASGGAAAQSSGPEGPSQSLKTGAWQLGSYDVAKVRILGVPAITVAVPVLADSTGPDAQLRARLIENNLRLLYAPPTICSVDELLADLWVRRSLRSHGDDQDRGQTACDINRRSSTRLTAGLELASVMSAEGLPVLEARLPGREPIALLTVTDADARLNGIPAVELAERWRITLLPRLRHAQALLQPEAWARVLMLLGLALLLLAALLGGLLVLWKRTEHWDERLQQRLPRGQGAAAGSDLLLELPNAVRIAIVLAVLLILSTMNALATMAIPGQFAEGLSLLLRPGLLIAKVLVVAFAFLVLRGIVRVLLRQWLAGRRVSAEQRPRRRQRYRTLRQVSLRLLTLSAGMILVIWWLVDLERFREITASGLLAGGALVGALVFAFQALLRDFVSGLVVLLEDRYAIGDWVEVGTLSGEVVDIGIFSSQFRTLDQRLVVVQHGMVDRLINHTKLRSGALISLLLSHRLGSLRQALTVIQQELDLFAGQSPWKERLLDPPLLRAVDAVNPQGIEVSVLIQTLAGEQWSLKRELLLRLKDALHRSAIPLANTLEWGNLEPPQQAVP
ncbi:mechanosensitive ion channel [Cyanobium sp. ATX 6A2]|uniref:mechanosensitive ion channel family protein n=1 Tax=Cyanobium sp. ATX 6A2 TaxID=2823700 RepID=UPI0020CD75B1|nr:mechanosensitive ion channel domain-containing protein [Cyanobium sp. ATX 6A2]MCP9889378.1 mechanosensitive ion channel [Cyanobium sp. ATX 6A2]